MLPTHERKAKTAPTCDTLAGDSEVRKRAQGGVTVAQKQDTRKWNEAKDTQQEQGIHVILTLDHEILTLTTTTYLTSTVTYLTNQAPSAPRHSHEPLSLLS